MGPLSQATPAAGNDWLSQLAPAHRLAAPGLWPPAPGWWLLLGLLLIATIAWMLAARRPLARQRRAARRELRALQQMSATADPALAGAIENLLRRYAVARYGSGPVARLSGGAWIDFIVAHGGRALAGTTGEDFLRLAYGGRVDGAGSAERERWFRGARAFIGDRT